MMYSVRLYHHEGLIRTESKAISPYGKHPAAGECRSGESTNTALKGVFPVHTVSEMNIMPKPKWNLNTIYISERLQESLGRLVGIWPSVPKQKRYISFASVYIPITLLFFGKAYRTLLLGQALTFCGTIPAPRSHELAGEKSCYIFVDDFHLLTDRRVSTFLCMLANRLPVNVHLI